MEAAKQSKETKGKLRRNELIDPSLSNRYMNMQMMIFEKLLST